MMPKKMIQTSSRLVLVWSGIIVLLLPIYIAFVTASHPMQDLLRSPIPVFPGNQFWFNLKTVLMHGFSAMGNQAILPMMWRSFVMAMIISAGKIIFSLLSAYAIVFFRFRLRTLCFWLIFITLMLPVEVRILPTFEVVARLHLLDSYAGLTLPLIASATATFLFRQFFMTIPDSLVEAARMDGAGPIRFLKDILLPLSKTNIAALFVIMFIYGWNQYLWPQVATTHNDMTTIVMGIQRSASVADQIPQWNYVMMTALLAALPPVLIIFLMQRTFVKGLIDVEK